MSNIVQRLKDYIDFKGISIAAFEKSVGFGNATFSKTLKKGGAIGTDKLENILRVYPEINSSWLLKGQGEMIQQGSAIVSFADRLSFLLNDLVVGCIEEGSGMNKVAAALGITSIELGSVTNKTTLPNTPLDIAGLVKLFPEVNYKWLLTGEGLPYMGDEKDQKEARQAIKDRNYVEYIRKTYGLTPSSMNPNSSDREFEFHDIPLYDLSAFSGLSSVFKETPVAEDYLRIPKLHTVDGAVYVRGESMSPLLRSGDIVIYKKLNLESNIIWGQMYLLSVELSKDLFTMLGYLQQSELDNHIRVIGENERFQPTDIDVESIKALAIVKSSISFHTIE